MSEASARQEVLFNLLLPLSGMRLLMPRVALAEVVGFSDPRPLEQSPDWLLGLVTWHEQALPLIAFEGLMDEVVPAINTKSRVAIIHALHEQAPVAHYGLVTQGFPQLISVHDGALASNTEANEKDTDWPVLSHIKLASRDAIIPDFLSLEHQLWPAYR